MNIMNHYPISSSFLQRLYLTGSSAVKGLLNPERGDMISVLGEVTGESALILMREKMKMDLIGRRILHEKPIINSTVVNIEKLLSFPMNSFGHQYALFMKENNISSDDRSIVKYIFDPELSYIMLRYRQIHDFWHTLSGIPNISVEGEIGLKWFEYFQTGLPMNLLAGIFGPIKLSQQQRMSILTNYIPWAIRNATSCTFLLNVYYEENLEKDLSVFRNQLGLMPFESSSF